MEDAIRHVASGHRGAFVLERDGARLVRTAVDWARAENRKLLPLCPYARSVFDKTPACGDVLA